MFGNSNRKALTKRGIKKMDALVTGLILGGIVTSIYGIKRTEQVKEEFKRKIIAEGDRHSLGSIIKMLVFGVDPVEKETKLATLWQRIGSFFRWNR